MDFDLEQLRQGAADGIDLVFQDLLSETLRDGTPGDLVELVAGVCHRFHTIASTTLLLDASPQDFFYNLCSAAENWLRLHQHLATRKFPLPPASENASLMGALAAGAWPLAERLARASRRDGTEGEYPDELTWARCLQELSPPGPQACQRAVEAAMGSDLGSAARAGVLAGLARREGEGFAGAFRELHAEHEAAIESRVRSLGAAADELAPHRFIWYEGLALLRVAEREGIACEEPFLYCPPLARVPMNTPFDLDWALPLGTAPLS